MSFKKIMEKSLVKDFLIVLVIAIAAYGLFPFVAKVPLRLLLSIIVGAIIFVALRRPANIQPSTITSIIALLVSYSALTHSISEWQQVNESKRPYFSIDQPTMVKLNDENLYKMMIPFENKGERSAHNIRVKATIIDLDTKNTKFIFGDIDTINDVPGGSRLTWTNNALKIGEKLATQIFGVFLIYTDPALNKCFMQRFVMKWQKKEGVFGETLNFITSDIPVTIIDGIDKFGNDIYDEYRSKNLAYKK